MYSLAEQLERRIARLSQQLRASAPRGRSVGALLALRRLEDEGPQRVSDLAAAELVAQPTMTVLVNRLVEEGLVRKTPHATDARAVLVAITDLGRAELFAFPSLYEGFGLPVLEAMACGAPVLTSDRSSLPEIGGVAAHYVDPDNEADIAAGIRELLSRPDKRAAMRDRGYAQAAKFRWDAVADRVLDGYEAVGRKSIAVFAASWCRCYTDI